MKIKNLVVLFGLLLSATGAEGQQGLESQSPTLFQHLLSSAERSHIPLGVVLDRSGGLCSKIVGEEPRELSGYTDILSERGYTLSKTGGVFVAQPTHLSTTTNRALNLTLPSFPHLRGHMRFMGKVLQGWLSSMLDGARGFAIDDTNSDHKDDLDLPASGAETVLQAANRLVSLGGKGIWTLSSEAKPGASTTETHFEVYSYNEDMSVVPREHCGSHF